MPPSTTPGQSTARVFRSPRRGGTWRLPFAAAVAVVLLALGAASRVEALSCADLDSEEKIKAHIERSSETNPLWRENLSVYLEVSPCEKEVCSREKLKERMALIQNIHFLRAGERRRVVVLSGPEAPQCVINRDNRNFICSQCDSTTNRQCRSVVQDSASGRIRGTNIDLSDWDIFQGKDYQTTCLAGTPEGDSIQLESRRVQGQHTYERIVSSFEKERGVLQSIEFFSEGVVRKVYRIFTKYYIRIGDDWVATIFRVRSTVGSEKDYLFETQVRILPDETNKPTLYLDPSLDPKLKGYDINSLFFTN
ncbi:MAG: hypothetical protein OEZ59_05415 [Deltaproteobacteria bacterium]|nr:hypothetical protein [Deltaproteobacteria bacterium]